MEFEQENAGDVTIVRFKEKKLTYQESPELKTLLLSLVVEPGEKILISLATVDTMDSTGLGAFLFGVRQADQHEKDMRFCCASDKIQSLVRIAHIESVIDLYDSEKEALKAFGAEEVS